MEELKSDCLYGSMNNLVWCLKKWEPWCEKRKTSSQSWQYELDEGCSLLEIILFYGYKKVSVTYYFDLVEVSTWLRSK